MKALLIYTAVFVAGVLFGAIFVPTGPQATIVYEDSQQVVIRHNGKLMSLTEIQR